MIQNTGVGRGSFSSLLRIVGSLWFAAILMVLLLTAMACGTVFESTHGTEQALASYYQSGWFQWLLGLLGLNILAAVVVRYPFTRRQVGFVLTHVAILLVLVGALVTKYFCVEGRLGLTEGETADYFTVEHETLTVLNQSTDARTDLDLEGTAVGGFQSDESIDSEPLVWNDLRVEIDQYLADSTLRETVKPGDDTLPPAVRLSLSSLDADFAHATPVWVFLDQIEPLGLSHVTFREVSKEDLAGLSAPGDAMQTASRGTVQIEYQQTIHELPIEDCTGKAVAVGDTGMTVRVRRYIPHATVAADNQVVNASPEPRNPAIEVELVREGHVETRIAFARFPDFSAMHGGGDTLDVGVTFVASTQPAPKAPVEILASPDGSTHVRFAWEGTTPVIKKIEPGVAVDTPWPGIRLTLLEQMDHARLVHAITSVDPVREDRVPAVHVRVTATDQTQELWLQRRRSRVVSLGHTPYEISYGDKLVPLGFSIALERFRVGYYPGGRRPRSFESRVSIVDPTSGRNHVRMISMNHPTSYGGYTFYQSSYDTSGGRSLSFLSVARDPGQPIVFAGYIAAMAGMLLVLTTRVRDRRRAELGPLADGTREPEPVVTDQHPEPTPRTIPLIDPPGSHCLNGPDPIVGTDNDHAAARGKPAQVGFMRKEVRR